jgi:hypothetical protein
MRGATGAGAMRLEAHALRAEHGLTAPTLERDRADIEDERRLAAGGALRLLAHRFHDGAE